MSRTGTANPRATKLLDRAEATGAGDPFEPVTSVSGRSFQATLGTDGTTTATVDIIRGKRNRRICI
jgi:hypothetical protein